MDRYAERVNRRVNAAAVFFSFIPRQDRAHETDRSAWLSVKRSHRNDAYYRRDSIGAPMAATG